MPGHTATVPHLRRYLGSSLALTSVVTIVLVVVAGDIVENQLLEKDMALAEQVAHYIWDQFDEHELDPEVAANLDSTDGAVVTDRPMEYVLHRFRGDPPIVHANLLDGSGRVVFTTNAAWRSKSLLDPDELRPVLRGSSTSKLLQVGEQFDLGGRVDQPLLESHIFVGRKMIGGVELPMVIELYQDAAHYAREVDRARRWVAWIALASCAAVFLGNSWLFIRGQRTISLRTRELEELSASLQDQVGERTKALESQRRLADVGRLSAGLAHEVNTPLASIAACAEGLLARNAREDQREYLEIIVHEAFRVRDITRDLLDVTRRRSHPDRGITASTSIREVFGRLLRLLGSELERRQLTVELDLDPADLTVAIDPGAFEQIALNVTRNAIDASAPGASIRWRVRSQGETVRLRCMDQGHGIPASLIDHVLDPFVTTKEVGEGSGLGLSIVHGLVAEAGGSLSVASEGEGKGATVTIFLPAHRDGAVPLV